jgi:fibronectin type 3 domain-containing protein
MKQYIWVLWLILAAPLWGQGASEVPEVPAAPTFDLLYQAGSESIRLQWDANTEADLGGYKVYWGPSTGNYLYFQTLAETPATPELTLRLINGTYFFAVTAYAESGLESAYSNEVTATVDRPDTDPPAPPTNTAVEVLLGEIIERLGQILVALNQEAPP